MIADAFKRKVSRMIGCAGGKRQSSNLEMVKNLVMSRGYEMARMGSFGSDSEVTVGIPDALGLS